MDIEIKKRIKTFWGCIPFAVFLLCFSLVAIVQAAPGNTLRILPRNILICFGVGCFGILLLWGNIIFSTFCGKKDKTVLRMISVLAKVLSASVFIVLVFASIFVMGYSHRPEHIVTRNGMKMVASVNSFLDEQVYYYQYKNWFFYGKELGYEYYGSGGNNPLAQTPARTPLEWRFYDLEGNLIESSAHEEKLRKARKISSQNRSYFQSKRRKMKKMKRFFQSP